MTLCNLQIHWFYISFASLFFAQQLVFHCLWNPPNKCAKLTRQMDPPRWPAKKSCHENLPNPPARMTRQIYLPEIPPSPLKIPRQDMLANLPPPTAPPTERGEGAGSRPGPPTHIEQVLFLSFSHLMNVYISLYNTTHTYSTQSGLNEV